jgi:hypothetical protein
MILSSQNLGFLFPFFFFLNKYFVIDLTEFVSHLPFPGAWYEIKKLPTEKRT